MSLRPAKRGRCAVFVVLPVLGLLSCSAPRPVLPPAPALDPIRALETVRAREDRITSLRARFSADTVREGERHSADGVLLVKKPDRFRLRLLLAFGVTIFDYLSSGNHAQLVLPMENKVINGHPQGNGVAFSQEDLGQAFLRGPNAFPGICRANGVDASGIVVNCRDAGGNLRRRIHIDARAGTILDETSYEGGRPRMVIRYDDYRSVGDVSLPFHIALRYPGQHLALDVAIQRYEINPVLADDLFQPVEPWAGS
jgi:hypothetical protein